MHSNISASSSSVETISYPYLAAIHYDLGFLSRPSYTLGAHYLVDGDILTKLGALHPLQALATNWQGFGEDL